MHSIVKPLGAAEKTALAVRLRLGERPAVYPEGAQIMFGGAVWWMDGDDVSTLYALGIPVAQLDERGPERTLVWGCGMIWTPRAATWMTGILMYLELASGEAPPG